jgi:hypothetical protein
MRQSTLSTLRRICTYLIKTFVSIVAFILLLCLLLGVFGPPETALLLFTTATPWVFRGMIFISCAITITSISESI